MIPQVLFDLVHYIYSIGAINTQLGGPSWNVKLGRRDSTTASSSGANSNIPGPSSSLQNLISSFSNQGLSANEMVALSGTYKIYLTLKDNYI